MKETIIDWSAIRDEIPLSTVIKDLGGKIGRRNEFCCPAHNDKSHPSAKLSKNKKRWVCFTCGEGGSNVDYVMHVLGLSKMDAALHLGRSYGIGIKEEEAEVQKRPPLVSMFPKEVLEALGLLTNPFFAVSDEISIGAEKFGTDWEFSSIPKNGYQKRCGPLKLEEGEALELLSNKCMEYLHDHLESTPMRRRIEALLLAVTEERNSLERTANRTFEEEPDFERGA